MHIFLSMSPCTGTAQQVFEWGAKEECVKEFFLGGGGGGGVCLWIFIQFLLSDGE